MFPVSSQTFSPYCQIYLFGIYLLLGIVRSFLCNHFILLHVCDAFNIIRILSWNISLYRSWAKSTRWYYVGYHWNEQFHSRVKQNVEGIVIVFETHTLNRKAVLGNFFMSYREFAARMYTPCADSSVESPPSVTVCPRRSTGTQMDRNGRVRILGRLRNGFIENTLRFRACVCSDLLSIRRELINVLRHHMGC